MKRTATTRALHLALVSLFLAAPPLPAQGDLAPGAPPDPNMKSLQELWDKIGNLESSSQALREQNLQNTLLLRKLAEQVGISTEGAWLFTTVDDSPGTGNDFSFTFAPDGTPTVAFYNSASDDLIFASRTGGSWQLDPVETAGDIGVQPDLAYATDGSPCVSYVERPQPGGTYRLKFARRTGGSWQIDTINATNNVLYVSSLAFTPAGQPAVVYVESNVGLQYAEWDGNSWEITTIRTDGFNTSDLSLAFNPAGRPACTYFGGALGGDLTYAEFDGTNWQTEPVGTADSTGGGADQCPLIFTANGKPATAWASQRIGGPTNPGIYYSTKPGATWVNSPVEGINPFIHAISLTLDPDDKPALLYSSRITDATRGLKLRILDGSWSSEIIDPDFQPTETSLDYSPDGRPAFATSISGDLLFGEWIEFSVVP